MFDSRDPHDNTKPSVYNTHTEGFSIPFRKEDTAMPIPDVRDYIALGLMAPEPIDNDAACPYCERTDGHEADCSEAADYGPHYRDYYSAAYKYDYEEHR